MIILGTIEQNLPFLFKTEFIELYGGAPTVTLLGGLRNRLVYIDFVHRRPSSYKVA